MTRLGQARTELVGLSLCHMSCGSYITVNDSRPLCHIVIQFKPNIGMLTLTALMSTAVDIFCAFIST